MTDPGDARFTHTHEWARLMPDGKTVRVGVSDFFQDYLSDVINIDLPEPGDHHYDAGEDVCVVESLNATTDLHAPVSGVVQAINIELLSSPELVNTDPYGDGWILEICPDDNEELYDLMDVDEYEASLPEEDEEE